MILLHLSLADFLCLSLSPLLLISPIFYTSYTQIYLLLCTQPECKDETGSQVCVFAVTSLSGPLLGKAHALCSLPGEFSEIIVYCYDNDQLVDFYLLL